MALRELIEETGATHKLVISACKKIAKEHFVIRYNFDTSAFELLALEPVLLNGAFLTKKQGFAPVKALD